MKKQSGAAIGWIAAVILLIVATTALVARVQTLLEQAKESGRAEIRAEWAADNVKAEQSARAEETRRQNERAQHEQEDALKLAAAEKAKQAAIAKNAGITASLNSLRDRVNAKCGGNDQTALDTCLAAEREASKRYSDAFTGCRSILVAVQDGLRRTADSNASCVTAYESLTLKTDATLMQPKDKPDG